MAKKRFVVVAPSTKVTFTGTEAGQSTPRAFTIEAGEEIVLWQGDEAYVGDFTVSMQLFNPDGTRLSASSKLAVNQEFMVELIEFDHGVIVEPGMPRPDVPDEGNEIWTLPDRSVLIASVTAHPTDPRIRRFIAKLTQPGTWLLWGNLWYPGVGTGNARASRLVTVVA